MKVSVVVPATDDPATLERCLAALAAGIRQPDEVVVVRDRDLRTPAAARNAGAHRAAGDVLVFVDADVVVHAQALDLLLARLEADPGLDAAFGAYDDRPGAPGVVPGFRYLLHHRVHTASPGPAETFWSGLGAVRREAFEAAGGFDPERRWLEDVDLGLRLRRMGRRILLEPAARATHLKHLTLLEMLRSDAFERAAPWTGLLLEHRRGARVLNLGRRHRAQGLLAGALALAVLARRPRGALAALAGFLALDLSFVVLVHRRRGPAHALAAVPLHVLHHLAALVGAFSGLSRALAQRAPR